MNEEFPQISQMYELDLIADRIAECLFNESIQKEQRLRRFADACVEYQEIMSISDEELRTQVHDLLNISESECLEIIKRRCN